MSKLENLHNPETQDTSYDHVLRYTGVFGGVQGLKLLMSVLRNTLTAKILGGVGIGLISVYNSFTEFIGSCCNFGIPLNATRISGELFEEGTNEQIEHFVSLVRTWMVWASILATLLCMAASPLISYIFFEHDWHHYLEVMIMIPVIVSFLIAEGECAILKGLRQVRNVALIETIVALLTVAITIPFYFVFGLRGVALGLILCGLASAATHLYFSTRLVSYKLLPFNKFTYTEGLPMIKKGIPYVLAGIANSLLAMAIPALMLMDETMAEVGYYRAGFMLMVGYAGIVFVALEADYFPRLSSVCNNKVRMNTTINQQIDVCVLFITPFLILIAIFMPLVVSILFDPEFHVIQNMALCASFYTFLRAISLPFGYTVLAKGDSLLYLLLEVVYDVIFGALIFILYQNIGLMGAGIALSVGAAYDVVVLLLVLGWKYGCRLRRSTFYIALVQFVLLAVTVACCLQHQMEVRYFVGGVAFILSLMYSIRKLSNRSDFLHRAFHHFRHHSGDCC